MICCMDDREHAERPWGSYTVLDEGAGYKVKRIVVMPGQRLSYQLHHRRSEHWFAVGGVGTVTLDGASITLPAGQALDVATGAAHRVGNTSADVPFVFIEVQRGDYCGEDDIVRLEDDYGRAGTS
jgi:mannose-6-phosphate isomerase